MKNRHGIVVVASGYFDPLHSGHVEYLERAKALGDYLIVIVNNDNQSIKKKGYVFMDYRERAKIVSSLKCVDEVVECIDEDGSVCKTLEMLKPNIFGKGGDRNKGNIPENEVCAKYGIKIVDGLGDKIQSSSWIIEERLKRMALEKKI